MAYDHGKHEHYFTTTGGLPYYNASVASTVFRMAGPWVRTNVVRAIAWEGTVTKAMGSAVIQIALATAGGSKATGGGVVDTITLGTGVARGKIYFVDGLRTVVSAGSSLWARNTTLSSVTGVIGRLVVYVDTQPLDLLNNTRATQSA